MSEKRKSEKITASTLASMGLGKAQIIEPEPEIVEVTPPPKPAAETMGFLTTSSSLIEMIKLMGLPTKSKDMMRFPQVELHFNQKRREVWWSNKGDGGAFILNFGSVSYDYFTRCWGNGSAALTMETILRIVNMYKDEQLTDDAILLTITPSTKKFELSNASSIGLDTYTGFTCESKYSNSRISSEDNSDVGDSHIKLTKFYIPILKFSQQLDCGADFVMSDIKAVSRKSVISSGMGEIILTSNPQTLNISIDAYDGKITSRVNCNSFCNPPSKDINILTNDLDTMMNIDGLVSLRISEKEKSPIYIKREIRRNTGVLRAGVAFPQKERT